MTYAYQISNSFKKLASLSGTLTIYFLNKLDNLAYLEDLYTFHDIGVPTLHLYHSKLSQYFSTTPFLSQACQELKSEDLNQKVLIGISNLDQQDSLTNLHLIPEWLKLGYHIRLFTNFFEEVYFLIPFAEKIVSKNLNSNNLHLCFGPMFSRKSTWLHNKLEDNQRVLKIISQFDKRTTTFSDDQGSTHHSGYNPLNFITVRRVHQLNELSLAELSSYFIIAIDEAQFYPDIFETVSQWLRLLSHKPQIYIAGLDGDSNLNLFGQSYRLIPLADSIVKRYAFCPLCLKDHQNSSKILNQRASFTRRLISQTDIICPGADNEYQPVCRYHYYQK